MHQEDMHLIDSANLFVDFAFDEMLLDIAVVLGHQSLVKTETRRPNEKTWIREAFSERWTSSRWW